jgi:hypothetical protein
LHAEFEREEVERSECECVMAEKEKQKDATTAEREQHIGSDALNRRFNGWISSYKKDDLRALALALSISDKGTNNDLVARIKDAFKTQPNLQKNSRFLGIFECPSDCHRPHMENRCSDHCMSSSTSL